MCFLLSVAYTFGLFDHILSSQASKYFCYDGWKILGEVTEACSLVVEAQKASTGQLPEARGVQSLLYDFVPTFN